MTAQDKKSKQSSENHGSDHPHPGLTAVEYHCLFTGFPCQLLGQSWNGYCLVTVDQMMRSSFQIINRNVT